MFWIAVIFLDTSIIIPWASSHWPSWFLQFWRHGFLTLLLSLVYTLVFLHSFPSDLRPLPRTFLPRLGWGKAGESARRGSTRPMRGPARIPQWISTAKPRWALLIYMHKLFPNWAPLWIASVTSKNNWGDRGWLFSLNNSVSTGLERNWPWVSADCILERVFFVSRRVGLCKSLPIIMRFHGWAEGTVLRWHLQNLLFIK